MPNKIAEVFHNGKTMIIFYYKKQVIKLANESERKFECFGGKQKSTKLFSFLKKKKLENSIKMGMMTLQPLLAK